jgi:hypothetical protein
MHKVLEELNITAGVVLRYGNKLDVMLGALRESTSSPLMGIGAGGNIRQSIVKDEEDPRLWATEESRIVNIQILNTVAFKSFTGFDAPKTPVSFETYVKNGLPFFQTYLEVPASLEYGFKQIKSSEDLLLQREQEMWREKNRPALPGYCEACFLALATVRGALLLCYSVLALCKHRIA